MEKEYTEQSESRNERDNHIGHDPDDLKETPGSKRLTKWKNEPTLMELRADLEFARQETNDQKSNVSGWLDLRNTTGAEAPKKAKPGRSSIQPKLVRKHNEWRYPALSEPFLNTDRMFQVLPRTHEDGPRAEQNQILLNWQWDTKLNKVDFVDRYVRTAVDEGSVIVRVGWEREFAKKQVEVPNYDYYPVTEPEKMQMIQQAIQLQQSGHHEFESLPETLKASAEKSWELQYVVEAVQNGVTKAVEDVIVKNCPSVRIINVANLFIDPSCDGDWEKAQFMIHTYEATESDLKKKRMFKNLDKVDWQSNYIQSKSGDPDHESNTPNDDSRGVTNKKKVLVYEYWGLHDIHEDGVLMPIVVTWIGEQVIQMEENPFPDNMPPFVIVPYMPILNSVFGEADASLLQDNQRIIGAVTRGMIDLMGRSANAQTGYAKGFMDPVNKRRFTSGEDFEFNPNGDPRQQIQQMQYPEIPRSAHETIMAQNAEAESLTGVKSFSGGVSGDAYGSVATGIRGALDSASTREMSILRRLAKGVQKIGEKMIAMNAVYLEEKEVVRVTNKQFVEISRAELEGNFDLKVDISTASVDEQRAQDLGFVLQTVGPDMDPMLRQIILGKVADLKRMPDLAEQIRSYQPQPDPMQQAMAQIEIEKGQAEVALSQARALLAEAQAQAAMIDAQNEATGLKHERDIEKQGAQARGNRDLEISKALTKGEAPMANIEAAIGWNRLTESKDERETEPRLGQGFSDPSMVPPQFSGQQQPLGPLGTA
ncbi:portal protein [Roseobacter phage RD-1410W1-01]|uniref:Virion protein n=1 Tax=Roseobacter phage RD-1410W1-01 TaxID=1815984 RepID=A0A191VYL1_9CAUD|nr:portal protein [Roseobacter phage RD-1410W1-01]ANJ20807.1 virion protein [Roseobacter phage RD-1410W1-01]